MHHFTAQPWDSDGNKIMADGGTKHLATVWNNDRIAPSEALANGQLMAASPELLRACQVLLADTEPWDQVIFDRQIGEARRLARAAMSKAMATGKE